MTEEELNELNKLPKTQLEAKQIGCKFYFSGKPCKKGHISPRYSSYGKCLECGNHKYKYSWDLEIDQKIIEDFPKLMELPRTKKEAIELGISHFFTAKPCKHGHIDWRNTATGICRSCSLMHNYARRKKYPEYRKKYEKAYKERKKNDPLYLLNNAISCSMRRFLRNQKCNDSNEILMGQTFFEFVGYTQEDLKLHLESLFELGMTWENYGNGSNLKENGIDSENRWQVDHIIPLSFFNKENIKDGWKLENLQPLWACDNMSKCNRYIGHPDNKLWIKEE